MANLINRDKKWAYLHIPKTGGISLSNLLLEEPGTEEIEGAHEPIDCLGNVDNYYIFCFVRNPFYQIMSGYFHMKSDADKPSSPSGIRNYLKPNEDLTFLKYIKLIEAGDIYMQSTQSHQIYFGSTPQRKVEFIARYENYDIDVKTIAKRLNIEYKPRYLNCVYTDIPTDKPTHIPADFSEQWIKEWTDSKNDLFRRHYTEQWMIDWVLDTRREDFENFGYSKTLI